MFQGMNPGLIDVQLSSLRTTRSMTESTRRCAEHPEIATNLRCIRCNKFVCGQCMVQAPVGIRCREHGQSRGMPTYEISAGILARAIAVGSAISIVGGALLGFVILPFLWNIPYVSLIPLASLGYVIGQGISLATNRKRGTPLIVIAVTSVCCSFAILVYAVSLFGFRLNVIDMLGLAASIYVAYLRLR